MCRRVINIVIVLFLAFVALIVVAVLFRPSADQAAKLTAQALAALPTLASLPTETPLHIVLSTQIADAQTRSAQVNNDLATNIAHATQVELTLQAPSTRSSIAPTSAVINQVVVAQSSTSTDAPSATSAPTNTLTPSETITNTMTPSLTPTLPPTVTPEMVLQPLSGTYYAQGSVNVRDCPRKDCKLIGSFADGQSFSVSGWVNGDEVKTGNVVWYQTRLAGHDGYVYSEFVTDQLPPTAPPPPAAPIVFQGNGEQLVGPVTLPTGLFRARVTTTGFFIAHLQVISGDCGDGLYDSAYLFNLMDGEASSGAETTIVSMGCTAYIQTANVTATWRIEITQIG